jgi:hypothetical protein
VMLGIEKRTKFRRSWSRQTQNQIAQQQRHRKRADYNFSTENDIQGIAMLEILGATDLAKIGNSASRPPLYPTDLTDISFYYIRTWWPAQAGTWTPSSFPRAKMASAQV